MDKTLRHGPKSSRSFRNALLSLLILFGSCTDKQEVVRILFVGDILLSRNVRTAFRMRKDSPWKHLNRSFKTADLVIGNLEGAVGARSEAVDPTLDAPIFDIDSSDIAMLRKAGFGAVTIENNHSGDLGDAGRKRTMDLLRKNNVVPIDYEHSPRFFTLKNHVIAVLAVNVVRSRDGSKPVLPSVEFKQKLRLAKSMSDLVVISIHWGSELLEWPDKEQRKYAAWLVANGADIIIGSHPHVIQKPELIHGKPVYFSLGNHLFDQKYPETKEGLMAEIRIQSSTFSCNGWMTHTAPQSFYPKTTEHLNFFRNLPLNNHPLTIDGLRLWPVSSSVGNKLVLNAYENGRKKWSSHPMSIVTIATSKLDGSNDYLFTLEKHYSSLDQTYSLRPYVYSIGKIGIYARWRGSGLAWPLIDAQISPSDPTTIMVLHQGNSFLELDKTASKKRYAVYRWNGFGFSGISDTTAIAACKKWYDRP